MKLVPSIADYARAERREVVIALLQGGCDLEPQALLRRANEIILEMDKCHKSTMDAASGTRRAGS